MNIMYEYDLCTDIRGRDFQPSNELIAYTGSLKQRLALAFEAKARPGFSLALTRTSVSTIGSFDVSLKKTRCVGLQSESNRKIVTTNIVINAATIFRN